MDSLVGLVVLQKLQHPFDCCNAVLPFVLHFLFLVRLHVVQVLLDILQDLMEAQRTKDVGNLLGFPGAFLVFGEEDEAVDTHEYHF